MDNGQHIFNPSSQDPFDAGLTAGVGTDPEKTNPLPSNENLNTKEFNYGAVGNIALNSPESPQEVAEAEPPQSEQVNTNKLGQVIDLPMPSLAGKANSPLVDDKISEATPVTTEPNFDNLSSKELIGTVKAEEQKLNQDGNIADFYSFMQNARKHEAGIVQDGKKAT